MKKLLTFLAVLMLACTAYALVGSRLKTSIPHSAEQLTALRKQFNEIRVLVNVSSLGELKSRQEPLLRLSKEELPRLLKALSDAAKQDAEKAEVKEFKLNALKDNEYAELLAVAASVDPKLAERIQKEHTLTNGQFLGLAFAIGLRVERTILALSKELDSASNSPTPAAIEKERLTIEMSRFDLVISYLIILIEQR
jgi:hypothetical protein